MKKFAVMMLLALVGVVANAQTSSLTSKLMGKWQANDISAMMDEELKNATLIFNLKADNQSTTTIKAEVEGEEEGMNIKVVMTISMPGTWSATSNGATIKPRPAQSTVKINKMLIDGTDFTSTAEQMGDMFKEQFRSAIGDDLGSLALTNIKFNGTTSFTCLADGERLTFRRKQ